MAPNPPQEIRMENETLETLETLIVRLRQYNPYPSTAISETQHKIAKELAPILAGLRELREQMQNAENYRTKSYIAGSAVVAESMKHFIGVFDKWLGQPATADQTAYGLSKSQDKRLKALGKPADQTGAKR